MKNTQKRFFNESLFFWKRNCNSSVKWFVEASVKTIAPLYLMIRSLLVMKEKHTPKAKNRMSWNIYYICNNAFPWSCYIDKYRIVVKNIVLSNVILNDPWFVLLIVSPFDLIGELWSVFKGILSVIRTSALQCSDLKNCIWYVILFVNELFVVNTSKDPVNRRDEWSIYEWNTSRDPSKRQIR